MVGISNINGRVLELVDRQHLKCCGDYSPWRFDSAPAHMGLNSNFFNRTYEIVSRIPPGKVATYKLIADILDTHDSRRVGHALHANPDGSRTPCHRVVFSDGRLAPGYSFGGLNEQRRRLELEGITFDTDKVNLTKYLWHP